MGFHEDERIRHKNNTHNAAYNLYNNLKEEGKMTSGDIKEYINRVQPAGDRPDSKEIHSLVLHLADGQSINR